MKRLLFENSLPRLRKEFVNARFGEEKIFGRSDVQAWFEDRMRRFLEPREGWNPWNAPAFLRHLASAWAGRDGELANALVSCATPLSKKEVADLFPDKLDECLRRLFGGLTDDTQLYGVEGPEIIAVTSKGALTATHGGMTCGANLRPAMCFRPTEAEDVSRALLQEVWQKKPKAQEAFAWIKAQYALAIAAEREAAERDFDAAVGVSANGNKIVKADWVVVVRENDLVVFPGGAFQDGKAELVRNCGGTLAMYGPVPNTLEGVAIHLTRFPPSRTNLRLFRERTVGFQHLWIGVKERPIGLLFVHQEHCPSPLPDGGREIAI